MVVNTAKLKAWQFLQLGEDPPGVKLELVNGEVAVSPSPIPRHSYAVMRLSRILGNHIDANNLGELHHDVDTELDEYNVRRPDLLYFSNANIHRIGEKHMEGPPDLAVEVISPSSVEVDREDKFEQYRAAKVMYYWIVDPELKTLEGWALKRSKYVPIGRGEGMDVTQLAPFADLQIRLEELWRK
jgi:Uma2 family endonuclease